ncbi:breast cancer anti-estrogen resistance protein 3 homolog isoform X2 [Amblyomma americanum]
METPVTTETPAEDLKKALEWELGLDSRDLRSHAWYHGTIPRQRAEELMTADGFFLVRDCVSRPGDYVLTCCWKGAPLHFVINKVVLQPFTVYERVQYQFEDDCFDTVPDLVTFYVGNKRPISAASGAVVSRPVNRSMPLSYYAQRYGIEGPKAVESSQQRPLDTSSVVPAPSNGITSEPHLPQKMHSSSHASTGPMSSCATLPSRDSSSNHRRGFIRVGSDPLLSPTLERRALEHRPLSGTVSSEATQRNLEGSSEDQPPPKPSRVPSKRLQQKPVVVKRDPVPVTQYVNNCEGVYSELADNGGSSIMAETSDLAVRPGDIKRHAMPHRTFIRAGAVSTTQAASAQCSDAVACNRVVTVPEIDPPSSFDLVTFATTLLPSDNKPLDKSIMARVRNVLLESGPRALANHLTRLDLDVLGLKGERDLGLGVTVGLELLALPQGSRFRKDLLERTECIKLFVASTLLMCADDVERVELLNKWIQVAGDTKTALGNLYGFTGIMQGLAMSQVSRLKTTWLALRQRHTDTALAYETKLRPALKNMQECSNPQAPNTCLPYLLSLLLILEHNFEGLLANLASAPAQRKDSSSELLLLPWEHSTADYGLQLLLSHLEQQRLATQQIPTFRRNGEIVFENVKLDDIMLDLFRTEFHLLFLWGARGATVASCERHAKLTQVLAAMSVRCEPIGTPV